MIAVKKLYPYLFLSVLVLACTGKPETLQDKLTVNDAQINRILSQMSLEEKVAMFHSKTNMSSEGVPRLGIQDIKYTDGPFGIREEGQPNSFMPAGWTLDSATYFPTGSALAATWDPQLAYEYGGGMGREARLRGKDIILGPAVNIQRLPVGGRSYEYLSEDPELSAELAEMYTKGAQDAGTAVCVKHFAANNQETSRGSVNVILDERTLREIYLRPFEAAVVDGGAMAVMPAYNKVNGAYCSENEHLLNEILRGEWGFKGMTVSDWGGTHSTMGAAMHGLNVQMTGDTYLGPALIDSVKAGKVPMEVIDEKAREILRVRYAIKPVPEDVANTTMTSTSEDQDIAYKVATKSIVLLKNDGGILPLAKEAKKIAVIGQNAVLKTASGGMGAGVKALYEISPLQGLKDRAGEGVEISYAPGYKSYAGRGWGKALPSTDPLKADAIDEAADPKLLEQAAALAKDADVVLFFCGTNKNIETEGSDRKDIGLPTGQNEVAQALASVNPNLVSIVISGGPCDLSELQKYSAAIIQGWWNGMEGGHALADVIYGKIAPSGKLPFTFPAKLEDSPAFALGNFPDKNSSQRDLFMTMYRNDMTGMSRDEIRDALAKLPEPESKYTEGMLVGYRWFDTKGIKPLYAFGHGLSYVDFGYSGLKANKKSYKEGDVIKVTFNLENKGSMEADEVAQLYVHRKDAKVEWPEKELKAFKRLTLGAGESRQVTLEIPVSKLRYWNVDTNKWELEDGTIELMLGGASDDIRQTIQVKI